MKLSFKLLGLLGTLLVSAAMATGTGQVATSGLVNTGSISNTVKTSAAVTGLGTSYSSASGSAGAVANGSATTTVNPVCSGTCGAKSGALAVTGEVKTYNNASAFNVSTGAGVGSASSVGSANATLQVDAAYYGPGQSVTLDTDMKANSSVAVDASKNTGGAASATNEATLTASGTVGSKVCTGNTTCGTSVTKEVWGSVQDTKNATSTAATGNMTVDGVVLAPANTTATANATVNVIGKFTDPI